MSAASEMDPTIRNAIKLVHSSGTDNAEKIRQTLDELIKSRFSSSKMLVNVLSKKHLAEENTAPGSGTSHRSHRHRSTDSNSKSSSSKSNSSNSSVSAVEVTSIPIDTPIMVELETLDEDTIMEELKELEELVCVVCRQVDVSFKNRLVECADCHSLYHQECHKPQISESDANDQEDSWICVLCKSKEISKQQVNQVTPPIHPNYQPQAPSVSAAPPHADVPLGHPQATNAGPQQSQDAQPPHKSSSSSYKSSSKSHESSSKGKSKSSSSSSKSRESSSSGSRESSRDKSSSSSSSSSMTPKINIISADKRIQIMKKKAKLNEGKRKHK